MAEPALPEIEPVMVLSKVLLPEKWLLSARRVEEAVLSTIVLQPNLPLLQVTAFDAELHVVSPPPKKLVLDAVVAKNEVVVALVVVDLVEVKVSITFAPVKWLSFASNVDEAAVIVISPDPLKATPFMFLEV